MHEPLLDGLEDYLEGKGITVEGERHLAECASCREELALMKAHTALLRELRAPADVEPRAGFYARVMNRIENEGGAPSLWTLFGESLFAKRLAYASMTFMVLLCTIFVSTQDQTDDAFTVSAPEAIMAEQTPEPVTATNPDHDRDVVLVNLATYQD